LQRELAKHLKSCRARNKDKVTKRFLSTLGYLNVPTALREVEDVYTNQPGLRSGVLDYLRRLPFSKRVASAFFDLFEKTELYDDATRFSFVDAVVNWSVPRNRQGIAFVRKLEKRLQAMSSAFDWLCRLVYGAKERSRSLPANASRSYHEC
jgi:hypothetical protein